MAIKAVQLVTAAPLTPRERRNRERRESTPLKKSSTPLAPEIKKAVDDFITLLSSTNYHTSVKAEKALMKYVQESVKGGEKVKSIPEMWRLLNKFGFTDPIDG